VHSICGEHQDIAIRNILAGDVTHHRFLDAQRPGETVALIRPRGLVRRDHPRGQLLLDDRMVPRQEASAPAPNNEQAAVANMTDIHLAIMDQGGCQRGAHAMVAAVGASAFQDLRVGTSKAMLSGGGRIEHRPHGARVGGRHGLDEGADCQPARHLAPSVTTYAICNRAHKERRA
jgi:hypothetical protein